MIYHYHHQSTEEQSTESLLQLAWSGQCTRCHQGKGFSRFPAAGSVRTDGVSTLSGLNLDICGGFLSLETKPTVSNNEVSMKWVSIRWG